MFYVTTSSSSHEHVCLMRLNFERYFSRQTSCKKSVVSSLFNRVNSIITNKDDLTKENARVKQMLKDNGYQESSICKIFTRIANPCLTTTNRSHRYPKGRKNEYKFTVHSRC